MAAMFYARYIPPPKTKLIGSPVSTEDVHHTLKASRKRKRGEEVAAQFPVDGHVIDSDRSKLLASAETGGSNTSLSLKVRRSNSKNPSKDKNGSVEAEGCVGTDEDQSNIKEQPRIQHRAEEKRMTQSLEHQTSDELREIERPKKEKKKKLKAQDASETKIANTEGSRRKEKRKSKRREEGSEAVADVGETGCSLPHEGSMESGPIIEEASKHKSIRSKYERSSKIAARLARKPGVSGGEGQENGDKDEEAIEKHGLVPLPQPPEILDAIGSSISALPSWLARPVFASTTDNILFESLSLCSSTIESLAGKGYKQTFAIQSTVLPMLLPGPKRYPRDICISAATGSGKTLAYVLPMVESLRGKPVTRLRGLVVVPTRELVAQVRETLQLCVTGTGLQIGTAVGNKNLKDEQALLLKKDQVYDPEGYRRAQNKDLTEIVDVMNWDEDFSDFEDESTCLIDFAPSYNSRVDILVCTPGRLVDHLKSTKGFTLEHVQWFIVDEADRLLDQSFQQWIEVVLPALQAEPKAVPQVEILNNLFRIRETRHVQKVILSATMTRDISKLMALRLQQPALVVLEGIGSKVEGNESGSLLTTIDLPQTLKETTLSIKNIEEKPLYLLHLLNTEEFSSTVNSITLEAQGKQIQEDDDMTSSSGDDSISSLLRDSSLAQESGDETSSDSSSSLDEAAPDASSPPANASETDDSAQNYHTPRVHGILIFTNNNENALRLARLLCLLKPTWAEHVRCLTKSTATSAGRRTLAAFRSQKISILIASDRASRGLDIQGLAHVINYDMPTSLTSYVHRIGRTARASRKGTATTLVAHHEARWFWNEIARSDKVNRGNKVSRIEWLDYSVSESDREAYEVALARLGQEARGHGTQ